MSYEPPSPQLFSFNSPLGMCMDCNGLGMRHGFPLHQLIVDENKSIQKGATLLLSGWIKIAAGHVTFSPGPPMRSNRDCGSEVDSLLKMKWKDIPIAKQLCCTYRRSSHYFHLAKSRRAWKHGGTWEGWANRLLESYRTAKNPMRRRQLEKYMEVVPCNSCHGERLNKQAKRLTANNEQEFRPTPRRAAGRQPSE